MSKSQVQAELFAEVDPYQATNPTANRLEPTKLASLARQWLRTRDDIIRKAKARTNRTPGACVACNGSGVQPHEHRDYRTGLMTHDCFSCRGTGHQGEEQIAHNQGLWRRKMQSHKAVLDAMLSNQGMSIDDLNKLLHGK